MAPSLSPSTAAACWQQQQIDAIELLLEDLGSVDPSLQHRASFQSCCQELAVLRQELVNLLIIRRHSVRKSKEGAHPTPGPA